MDNLEIVNSIKSNEKLKNAFYNRVIKKYHYDGYFNSAHYHKKHWKKQPYYNDTNIELNKITQLKENDDFFINKVLTIVLVNSKSQTEECNEQVTLFLKQYIDDNCDLSSELTNYYIHKTNIQINQITSINNYLELLINITKYNGKKNKEIFFRGQSDSNFILLPSILRNKKWYSKEQYFYNSIIRMCPKDFYSLWASYRSISRNATL